MLNATLLGLMLLAAGETAPAGSHFTLDQIHLRDPFILPVREEGAYYLFGTGWGLPGGPGFMTYRSTDLVTWEGPTAAFTRPERFESINYWAPEVHPYRGKYYMFATFCEKGKGRGTRVLVAEKPGGPYRFHSDGFATPRNWMSLDGTLFLDEQGAPWLVFCHEWVQVIDGEIAAVRLSEDLKQCVGEPLVLFRASEAPWRFEPEDTRRTRVTDGPFLHRTAGGALLMIWSSFGPGGYKQAVARSVSGKIDGPWQQEPQPIYETDGGHGMLFRALDDTLLLVLHQPNGGNKERPRLFTVEEKGESLALSPYVKR